MLTITEFIIIALGVWRIANMIVDDSEDGPYDIFHLLRFMLGERGASPDRRYLFEEGAALDFWWNLHYQMYRATSCLWCLTPWLGLFFGILYLVFPLASLIILFPFSISAGALIVNRYVKK